MEKLTNKDVESLSVKYGYPVKRVNAVIEVESNGLGFDPKTGKIIIQFEPSWFKRKKKDWITYSNNSLWQHNKVGNQKEEWSAFNSAFAIDKDAAMQSTSIGKMQVMGFHFKLLGFKTVGEMWDFAKESEKNQVELGLMFIKKNANLNSAILKGDAKKFAYNYNGELYHLYNYDNKLIKAGF